MKPEEKERHWGCETGIMKHAEANERKRIKADTRRFTLKEREQTEKTEKTEKAKG